MLLHLVTRHQAQASLFDIQASRWWFVTKTTVSCLHCLAMANMFCRVLQIARFPGLINVVFFVLCLFTDMFCRTSKRVVLLSLTLYLLWLHLSPCVLASYEKPSYSRPFARNGVGYYEALFKDFARTYNKTYHLDDLASRFETFKQNLQTIERVSVCVVCFSSLFQLGSLKIGFVCNLHRDTSRRTKLCWCALIVFCCGGIVGTIRCALLLYTIPPCIVCHASIHSASTGCSVPLLFTIKLCIAVRDTLILVISQLFLQTHTHTSKAHCYP